MTTTLSDTTAARQKAAQAAQQAAQKALAAQQAAQEADARFQADKRSRDQEWAARVFPAHHDKLASARAAEAACRAAFAAAVDQDDLVGALKAYRRLVAALSQQARLLHARQRAGHALGYRDGDPDLRAQYQTSTPSVPPFIELLGRTVQHQVSAAASADQERANTALTAWLDGEGSLDAALEL